MKKINRSMFFSFLVVVAYVLSACSGAPAAQTGNSNDQSLQSGQVQQVVFTGTVDSIGGGQWTVSGQAVTVDGTTSVDANIVVGDNVKVEARVGQDGSVTAVRVELSGADDAANANSNSSNGNDSNVNANDNAANANGNQNDNSNSSNDNGNANSNSNGNSNDNSNAANDQEISGSVEAITTDSITINGVVYLIADFTEFKGIISLGDNVKVHVILNADGTLTIREIEKSAGTSVGNGNSNDNSNSNVNSNSNDDDQGGNGNDDNSNGSNSNDDDDNDDDDDNGNDDNSNSNGNG